MMNDEKWMSLLALSTPTFAGEATPSYGFVTATLARLREELAQVKELERIGWRAVLASLGALAVAVAITVTVDLRNQAPDLDPGVPSLVQMDKIQFS
jgi:ethanolamine utilization cobalamin adenosyltransferase